jgi:hypothetical protein
MNRAFRFSLLAAATLSLVASACATERDIDQMYGEPGMTPEGMERIGAIAGLTEGARLVGDIGPVEGIDHDAQVSEWGDSWDEGYGETYRYDSIQLDVYDGSKWAMIMLDVQGGLNHPRFEPGNTLSFQGYGYDEPMMEQEGGELYVSAIGCSSDDDVDMDSWIDDGGDYFDEPADEVYIEVLDGPTDDTKILDVTTTYPSTGQEARAGIVVPR